MRKEVSHRNQLNAVVCPELKPFYSWEEEAGGALIDKSILDIILKLNEFGWATDCSCSGHPDDHVEKKHHKGYLRFTINVADNAPLKEMLTKAKFLDKDDTTRWGKGCNAAYGQRFDCWTVLRQELSEYEKQTKTNQTYASC